MSRLDTERAWLSRLPCCWGIYTGFWLGLHFVLLVYSTSVHGDGDVIVISGTSGRGGKAVDYLRGLFSVGVVRNRIMIILNGSLFCDRQSPCGKFEKVRMVGVFSIIYYILYII